MSRTKYLNPSPKVSVSKDAVTLAHTISYDYDDSKLKTLSLKNFEQYARQRFPALDSSCECAQARVVIKLPPNHQLRHDVEDDACELIFSTVGKCLPIFDKGIEIGFQNELSSKDEISDMIDKLELLIKALSSDPDTLRGMRIQISMFKKAQSTVWAFE